MALESTLFRVPSSPALLATVALFIILLLASFFDLVHRRIPNMLIVIGLLLASGLAVTAGWGGIGRMLIGFLAAMFIFIPVYAAGVMAAGDVKLISVVGAFLGVHQLLQATLFILIAGGLLALVFWYKARLQYTRPGMPYAIAIFTGVLGHWLFAS